jgi:hypothetical protein
MTGLFVWMIWFGGVFAMDDRKIGFSRRLIWPMYLGEMLHEKIEKARK